MVLLSEIRADLDRAKRALASAERNFDEGDLFTAANRLFVACKSAVYASLKKEFGSISMSRERILTRLGGLNQDYKEIYDQSYDLRVQADYGKETRLMPFSKENIKLILTKVTRIVQEISQKINLS